MSESIYVTLCGCLVIATGRVRFSPAHIAYFNILELCNRPAWPLGGTCGWSTHCIFTSREREESSGFIPANYELRADLLAQELYERFKGA